MSTISSHFLSKIIPLGLCICLMIFQSCKKKDEVKNPDPVKIDYTFSGSIQSTTGEKITDATVLINGKEVKTEKDGSFTTEADSAGRFVVTIKKRGYGVVSKVFYRPVKNYDYRIRPAFTAVINPAQANTIRDTNSQNSCVGSGLQGLKFDAEYKKIPFVYDEKGNLRDFGWPSGMQAVFDYVTAPPVCNPGASITIPANAIVNASGQAVTTPVTISITTIDLQSRDGMPGDYTYEDGTGNGVMTSLGAVSIEAYSDREDYNLSPQLAAKLSLPVEPAMLKLKKKIPETIPLLYYDEKKGVWVQEKEQIGRYNPRTNAYEAELNHFSSINMDFKEPNPTCFTFRQEIQGAAPMINEFNVGMLTSTASAFKFSTTSGNELTTDCFKRPDNSNLHLVYNGPGAVPGAQICVIMTEKITTPGTPPTAFYGISIVDVPSASYGAALDFICPCTSATTAVPPNPCFDGGAGGCDEALSGCDPFHSSCGDIKLKTFTNDVILAAKTDGGSPNEILTLKWIFKTSFPVGTTSYSYTVSYFDAGSGSFTDMAPVTVSPYVPGAIGQATVTVPSTDQVRITINSISPGPLPAGTWTSNVVGI